MIGDLCFWEENKKGLKDILSSNLIKEFLSKKGGITKKFIITASCLDPESAIGDAAEFSRLYGTRNGLYHDGDTPSPPLPTEAIQNLLIKYMKLHLNIQK